MGGKNGEGRDLLVFDHKDVVPGDNEHRYSA